MCIEGVFLANRARNPLLYKCSVVATLVAPSLADSGNHRVQIVNVSNPLAPAYVATIGVTGQPGSDNAHLDTPMGVADGKRGH